MIQPMPQQRARRFPFGSTYETTRERAADVMRRAIHFASVSGARVIQLAGYDVYYEPPSARSSDLFLDGLARSTREAAGAQVMLALEIMDTEYLNSIQKFVKIRDHIKSPWLQVYPDVGNLTAWGHDVSAELALGAEDIVGVHLKDTKKVRSNFPGQFRDVPFGSGDVNFVNCFRALETLGYAGPYLMEMWARQSGDELNAVRDAKTFLEGQFRKAMILAD